MAAMLGTLVILVGFAPVGQADPLDCSAVAAQIEAHNESAAAHNANPPNPRDEAAVAAYNAEAERGNAEIPELESLAAQCRQQGQDVPQVGAPPKPDEPQQCPAALVITPVAAGQPQVACPPPAPQPAPPPPANRRNPRPAVPANVLPPLSRVAPGAPTTAYQPWQVTKTPLGAPQSSLPPSFAANPALKTAPGLMIPAPGQANPSAAAPNISETAANFLPYAMQYLGQGTPLPPGSYGIPNPTGYDAAADSTPVVDVHPGGGVIAYGPTDGVYGPSGVYMRVVPGMKNQGTAANRALLDGITADQDAGHLAGATVGGSGRILQNLIRENAHNNRGVKSQWDSMLTDVAEGTMPGVEQQVVHALVIPVWGEPGEPPVALWLFAWGEKGWNLPPIVIDNS
ncbi:hypothetical protein ABZ942_18745 [Nocardia sp. NPDC046473]|uniref:hypothetical protein n=1 Tax=Nocardia sp. NPDC046473 TaxID=3155733 RepID=UPI0033F0A90E